MKVQSLKDLYVLQLKDTYYAEKQLLKALPKLAKAATNAELQKAFLSHRDETEVHVERLETIFDELEKAARGEKCEAIEGIVEEGKEMIELDTLPEIKDVALICAGQKAEHYEMANYGTLIAWAKLLGFTSQVKLLEQTLAEEKAADAKLSKLAETKINPMGESAGTVSKKAA